jgi:hypothetical protein
VSSAAVTAQLKSALQTRLTALVPGTSLTFASVLDTLRDPDDAKYAIDPLGTQLVFQAGDQFTTLAHDGSYDVPAGRTFTVVDPVVVQ